MKGRIRFRQLIPDSTAGQAQERLEVLRAERFRALQEELEEEREKLKREELTKIKVGRVAPPSGAVYPGSASFWGGRGCQGRKQSASRSGDMSDVTRKEGRDEREKGEYVSQLRAVSLR